VGVMSEWVRVVVCKVIIVVIDKVVVFDLVVG